MNSKCSKNNLLKSLFISFILVILGAVCSLSFFSASAPIVNADGISAAAYLDKNWFSKTELVSKNNVTEIYFQTEAPQTYSTFVSVAVKDESCAEYDGTTADVIAYLTGVQSIQIYIVSAQKIYAPASCADLFKDFTALVKIEFNNFDTSKAVSMQSMFSGCDALENLDLSCFDTSKVTNMREMFVGCDNLKTINLESFNTSSVQKMMGMFYNCINLTSLDLSNFDTTSVQSFSTIDNGSWTVDVGMFQGCARLEEITFSENFKTGTATNLNNMFYGCASLQVLD
ncbi:MAG: BspA family leucine-rich repeat surface protein, partial [Clostridia bacterium]|nr:BspA family leucine-rich repeat surface protein [Clostridia bacterium]